MSTRRVWCKAGLGWMAGLGLASSAHATPLRAVGSQFARIFVGRGIPAQARVAAEHAAILRKLRRGDREGAAQALQDHIVDSLERDARLADVSLSLARLVPARPPRTPRPKRNQEENR